jgi:NADH:ubiquinone oxidoreductase subunit 3 (subunit A)
MASLGRSWSFSVSIRARRGIDCDLPHQWEVDTIGLLRQERIVPFQALLDNYLAVFLAVIVGIILVATALIAARVLAPFSKEGNKRMSYECGMVPIGSARAQINLRYYLFAILFLIFDVEAVFLFPWAVNIAESSQTAFWEMVIFIGILAAGLGYAWRKGVLQWHK